MLNTPSDITMSDTSPITLVVSQGQSRNPEKRLLETELAERSIDDLGLNVLVVPHVYDLVPGGASYNELAEVSGPIVFTSWLYGRAAFWILDRNGIQGQFGEVDLVPSGEDIDDDEDGEQDETEDTVLAQLTRPSRHIYCLDFRATDDVDKFLGELRRISEIESSPSPNLDSAKERFDSPVNSTALSINQLGQLEIGGSQAASDQPQPRKIEEHPGRRWYPVIDFSRCTNCMECIDFCLFGVYGVDGAETILVEQPDNCRKGCPACSRVCPHNAIIFPQHKTPAIAGAAVDTGGLKIDLSKLFGAPESDEDAAAVAARERDEQLILAGRAAVGTDGDKPEPAVAQAGQSKDELDSLIDELDDLDL